MAAQPYPELLYLFLNLRKQQCVVPMEAWEYLTMRDLAQLPLVSKTLKRELTTILYNKCCNSTRDDYLVPYPGFPGLQLSSIAQSNNDSFYTGGLFSHQLASLRAMHQLENPTSHSSSLLRGGVLGDAPGLGKTITLLALICSTAGARTVPPPTFWNDETIQDAWSILRMTSGSSLEIRNALKPIRHEMNRSHAHHVVQRWRQVEAYVTPPYPDDRLATVDDFRRYVMMNLRDVVPRSTLELFRLHVVDLKAGLDKTLRSFTKSATGSRIAHERRLVPSSATLIIVPNALLEHWYQHIYQNLNLNVFAEEDRRGVVYICGMGDLADIQALRNQSLTDVPPPWVLSKYVIVVTTFAHCKKEFRQEVGSGRLLPRKRAAVESSVATNSSLLSMRWLRLVIDEGHELGTHETGSEVTQFIHQIAAERRWVLSGTPTTGDEDSTNYTAHALDQMQRLLFFLRHPKYGALPPPVATSRRPVYSEQPDDKEEAETKRNKKAKSVWVKQVKKPFLARKEQGREELISLLKDIMVMHRKEDINLPKPIFSQVEVDVQIPVQVEMPMLGTDGALAAFGLDKYLHSSGFQSLVDKAQADHIVATLRKARYELAHAGRRVNGKLDTRPIKAVVYSSKSNVLLSVSEQMLRQLAFENVAEMYDSPSIGDMSAEISRFRHGFKECRFCPVCKKPNESSQRRCGNQLLEVVLSDPPYTRFLIEPERIQSTLNVNLSRMNGEQLSSYSQHSKFWRSGDELRVDIRDAHPILTQRESEETWATFGAHECKLLAQRDNYRGRDWYFGPLPAVNDEEGTTVKVDLFKWQACGAYHSHGRWFQGPRYSDVPLQRVQEDVFVLSLDAGLAHGLDLSFVTHIFLLEPIADAALLEQVTSRAHRLGATGSVLIETVNVFYKVSNELKHVLDNAEEKSLVVHQEREKTLSKVVCHYCYREFPSHGHAEDHERRNCQRNPNNNTTTADPFHLSSIYREIRPPAAKLASDDE